MPKERYQYSNTAKNTHYDCDDNDDDTDSGNDHPDALDGDDIHVSEEDELFMTNYNYNKKTRFNDETDE